MPLDGGDGGDEPGIPRDYSGRWPQGHITPLELYKVRRAFSEKGALEHFDAMIDTAYSVSQGAGAAPTDWAGALAGKALKPKEAEALYFMNAFIKTQEPRADDPHDESLDDDQVFHRQTIAMFSHGYPACVVRIWDVLHLNGTEFSGDSSDKSNFLCNTHSFLSWLDNTVDRTTYPEMGEEFTQDIRTMLEYFGQQR